MNSYYSEEELGLLGLKSFGKNVMISRKTSIYSAEKISVGNNVRIDDFCVLSGAITIGNYVHINPYNGIFAGSSSVVIEDYTSLSTKISIYAISDDYSGEHFTSTLLPDSRQFMKEGVVVIKKYVIIGSGTVILPGVTIEEGCAIGAQSLIKSDTKPWGIYAGSPLKFIRTRSREMLNEITNE